METNDLFGANLTRIRKQKGLSQRELAEKSGISYRMICHYETRATAVPMSKLRLLADVLQVRIADFFGEDANSLIDSLDVRWIKKMHELQTLSESDQKEINQHINSLLEKTRLKKDQMQSSD